MAFRRGLRSLLLKTHPDLFAQPADAAKRADNEASLAILNTLVDGATALAREEPATVRFTNPRLHLRLHRRTGGTAIEHHVEVPEWLQRGSRDSEAVRRWCTDSVMALLVTAGEAVPTQVTQQAGQGSDWLAVPAGAWIGGESLHKSTLLTVSVTVDFAALRREVYETLVFGRDPSQPGQTDAQWAAQLHQARCNYWLARVIIAPSVTLLQSHQTLDMLRAFAREERELFEAVFAIPVHVVPSAMDYAGDESALLLCPWNTSLSEWAAYAAARQQSVTEAARVRASQVRFLLAGCDELCVQGQWQGVALSQALLGCDPRVALDALVSLVRDDAEGLLHGCQVHASLGHPALSTVDTKLHENSDGTVCPSVRVRIAYDVAWTPTYEVCPRCWCLFLFHSA